MDAVDAVAVSILIKLFVNFLELLMLLTRLLCLFVWLSVCLFPLLPYCTQLQTQKHSATAVRTASVLVRKVPIQKRMSKCLIYIEGAYY